MHTGGTTNTLTIQVHGKSADIFLRNGVDEEFAVSEINKFYLFRVFVVYKRAVFCGSIDLPT